MGVRVVGDRTTLICNVVTVLVYYVFAINSLNFVEKFCRKISSDI